MAQDVRTTIKYDGPGLSNNEMDVQELAPALLALADMIQYANSKFNGETSTMTVRVRADVEQKCFMLEIHIVQNLIEAARHLFTGDNLKSAKEIAEYLDLIIPGGVAGGVWWLLQRAYGDKIVDDAKPLSSYETEQRGGLTIIQNFYGPGQPLEVKSEVYDLATDPEIVASSKKVLASLERPGYESLGFYEKDKPTIELRKDQAKRIIDQAPVETPDVAEPAPVDDEVPTPIRATVFVKTQRNEGTGNWELKWAARAESASIDDLDWLARFQRGDVPHDLPLYLDVSMEMITSRSNPDAPARFRVVEVHGVVPNSQGKQSGFFDDKSS